MTKHILQEAGIQPETHMLKDLEGSSSHQKDYTGFDPENPFRVTIPNRPREKYDETPVLPEGIKPEEVKHVEMFINEVRDEQELKEDKRGGQKVGTP